ncbi:MAG: putative endonuclease 4 [Candidatus Magasanikbacteria bacterium GW2011_GWC2_34_16]|uniref:Probable endonuclease 4 n=2 Tax=Candidatus Magasanikiibacteriota TaxID=1752731 RepID=A0A0G0HFP6_9BACT|nr:MAG: putative endonuclease 4 [Candidatus Magasanikbacteria bacterium GW2011_GWC2_34_16]KKQ41027.1 MAG: putative endonuclease 4 [Candidatus Magasanikbacteria bacterium GW2011_GWA2_37_8]
MLFGAHVSIAGGLNNAPKNAADLGCEVFQMFTRSPQGGWVPPLNKTIAKQFKTDCKKFKLKEWVVHTPYFINFASANPRIYNASIAVVLQELERASMIGAKYLMTHLGSYKDLGHDAGLKQLVEGLDKMLKGYKGETKFLIEISAGAGEIIGDTFEEIAEIIFDKKLIKYDIGVCYDTQHGFASGYDIRNKASVDATLKQFNKIIGLEKLKMSHCNDSATELASRRDRHEHIGKGKIGVEGFRALLGDKRLDKINFILETEHEGVENDLKLLKKIRGK